MGLAYWEHADDRQVSRSWRVAACRVRVVPHSPRTSTAAYWHQYSTGVLREQHHQHQHAAQEILANVITSC